MTDPLEAMVETSWIPREPIAATVVAQPHMVGGSYPTDVLLETVACSADPMQLVVMAVVADRRQTQLFRGNPRRELGELSRSELVAATRAFRALGAG